MARSEISALGPLSMLGFGLARACTGLTHTVTTTLSSYMHLPWYAKRTMFLIVFWCFRLLCVFCLLFPNDPWALGGKGVVYMLCTCVCVCMYVCMYACMYVYACMQVCMYACMYVCMYVYVCIHVCMFRAATLQSLILCMLTVRGSLC